MTGRDLTIGNAPDAAAVTAADDYRPRDEVLVRTEPFTLPTARGPLRGLLQYNPTETSPRGTVVVTPPFGVAMRRGQAIALYFLFNGFDVIRYDPTNHVGISAGDIADLTSTALVEDLGTVLDWASRNARRTPPSLFASSISARLAFALLAQQDWGLHAVGTVSAVVNMRTAITGATDGSDYVGDWLSGTKDPDTLDKVMDHMIRFRFCQDLVDRDWHTAESTARDTARLGSVPLISVHGARDEWVDVDEAQRVLSEHGRVSLVTISDAVHALNPASARTAMTELVRFFVDPDRPYQGTIISPEISRIVDQSKSEGKLEQRENPPPFAEVTHRGLLSAPAAAAATSSAATATAGAGQAPGSRPARQPEAS